MKPSTKSTLPKVISRRDALALTLLASALSLAGCGGGSSAGGDGNVAGVSSGGTGSFSTGSISGLGSIIVAGVRFDDSTASTIRDIDNNTDLRGQLKLGMAVRVKGKPKSSDGLRADADSIEVGSNLLGPIDSIDRTATTLLVLGQNVRISTATIFEDGLTGLAALKVGDIVEVHGFSEPTTLAATRVEKKLLGNVRAFKLQGAVRNLNDAGRTFAVGPLTIGFGSADLGGLVLRDGRLVRIQLNPTVNTGQRIAIKIRADELAFPDVDEAEVEGTISSFTSSSQFSVNGVPVNAGGAAVPAGLALGALVEVEGSLVGGVLIARKVELKDRDDPLKFELHGTISALNTSAKTFVLRGVTVSYSGTVRFRDGIAADLSNVGSQAIEVKGLLSADGTQVSATEIRLDR